MEFQDKTSVKVLLPHWFDDVVRLGMPTLSTKPYEWPDPPFLRSVGSAEQIEKRPLDPMKKTLMRTATEMGDIEVDSIPSIDLWGRKRVLVSSSLDLTRPRREAIEAVIERGNGVVLSSGTPEEEATRVNDCDVLITNYRSGKAYFNVGSVLFVRFVEYLGFEGTGCKTGQDHWHLDMDVQFPGDRSPHLSHGPITSLSRIQKKD